MCTDAENGRESSTVATDRDWEELELAIVARRGEVSFIQSASMFMLLTYNTIPDGLSPNKSTVNVTPSSSLRWRPIVMSRVRSTESKRSTVK